MSDPVRTADVAVIIPTFDRPVLIKETIESVLGQTLPVKELLVVDNGPYAQDYQDMVAGYGSRVRYLRNDPPGSLAARNAGLRAAATRWVAFLDDDDLWHPDFIATAQAVIDSYPECTFIGADHVKFEGQTRQHHSNFELAPSGYWDGIRPADGALYSFVGKFPVERLLKRIPFYPSSSIVERDLALAIGGFDLRMSGKVTEDIEYLIRVLTAAQVAIIWKPMMEYRLHAGSYSRGHHRQELGRWEIFEFSLENHASIDGSFRQALAEDLPLRRARAFDVAFILQNRPAMNELWNKLEPSQRTWRMRLRHLLSASPGWLSRPLQTMLIRSDLSER